MSEKTVQAGNHDFLKALQQDLLPEELIINSGREVRQALRESFQTIKSTKKIEEGQLEKILSLAETVANGELMESLVNSKKAKIPVGEEAINLLDRLATFARANRVLSTKTPLAGYFSIDDKKREITENPEMTLIAAVNSLKTYTNVDLSKQDGETEMVLLQKEASKQAMAIKTQTPVEVNASQ